MCSAGRKRNAIRPLLIAFVMAVLSSLYLTAQGTCIETIGRKVSPPLVEKSDGHFADYDKAMAVVASLLREKFGLPVSQPKLLLYSTREAFEANLVHVVRFDPVYAREVAGWAVAVGAPEMVLANEEALERIPWSERIRVLAHELVHTVQYGLSGGRRGTSDQWLREGFADWIAYRALESLDPGGPSKRRNSLSARIKGTAHRSSCAPLSEMVTLEDFMKSRVRFGGSSVYGQSLLATEFLVQRHGVQTVLHYFGLFRQSDDRLKNFRTAFGEDLAAFEKEFVAYLEVTS
jgi:Protein DA1